MDATPGEGEQAKGGERQDVARVLPPMDGRLARYPLSRETSRRVAHAKTASGIFIQANEY